MLEVLQIEELAENGHNHHQEKCAKEETQVLTSPDDQCLPLCASLYVCPPWVHKDSQWNERDDNSQHKSQQVFEGYTSVGEHLGHVERLVGEAESH